MRSSDAMATIPSAKKWRFCWIKLAWPLLGHCAMTAICSKGVFCAQNLRRWGRTDEGMVEGEVHNYDEWPGETMKKERTKNTHIALL